MIGRLRLPRRGLTEGGRTAAVEPLPWVETTDGLCSLVRVSFFAWTSVIFFVLAKRVLRV